MTPRTGGRPTVVGMAALAAFVTLSSVAGCAGSSGLGATADPLVAPSPSPSPAQSTGAGSPSTDASATPSGTQPATAPTVPSTTAPTPTPPVAPRPIPTNAEIRVTVPDAGIRNLRVVRYSGTPDDTEGTSINNRGFGAAPYGSWGGVAPGQVGNFLVAGHRLSAGSPMYRVPNLRPGAKILVQFGGRTFTYRAATKLWINFRSPADRALQSAPVPGKPGATATRPAIVLTTCATPEDNAAGLTWRDENTNPTHRIAIVGYAE